MFIGAGFFLFRCQSLCAFLKMFLFGFLSSSHSDLLSVYTRLNDGNGVGRGAESFSKDLCKVWEKQLRRLQGFVISMAERVVAPIERPESCSSRG